MDPSENEEYESENEMDPTSILSAEIKELRNKIISVKKSVTKGDKKQKKAIQDELSSLETLLVSKQEELQRLKENVNTVTMTVTADNENSEVRVNKARMKKERRKEEKAAEWEANRQAALAEIASRPDLALEESKAFAHKLSERGFRIVEVAADGHCLFSAIGCQLNPPKDHWELRAVAAKFLLEHRNEFECFLDFESEAGDNDDDKYAEYCRKIESTGMWGGQLELEALSRALDVTITVIQSDAPELNFNEGDKERIYLSFHRYAFSLGEHYNALLLE